LTTTKIILFSIIISQGVFSQHQVELIFYNINRCDVIYWIMLIRFFLINIIIIFLVNISLRFFIDNSKIVFQLT